MNNKIEKNILPVHVAGTKERTMQKTAIFLMSNEKYIFALGAFIINIKQYLNNIDSIIIYCSGFNDDDIKRLKLLDSRIVLVKYELDDFIREFINDTSKFMSNRAIKGAISRYSHLHYAKIKAFQLLKEYEKIIFFDLDMLLLGNMDDILSKNEYNILWKWDPGTIGGKIRWGGYLKKLNFDDFSEYDKMRTPNGGFFILNKNFDYEKAFDIARTFLLRCFEHHPFLIDELIFGYVAYKMKLNIFGVNENIYNVFPNRFNTSSKLLHFFRSYKPWTMEILQFIFPQWKNNYKEFIKITGAHDELEIFNNIGRFVLRIESMEIFYKILLKNIFPVELEPSSHLDNDEIILTINNWQYFTLKKHGMANGFDINIKFKVKSQFCSNEFRAAFNSIVDNDKRLTASRGQDEWTISLNNCNIDNIQESFLYLYNKTFEIRSINNMPLLPHYSKKGFLKTYFGKYLCLNGLRLHQTEDENMSQSIITYMYDTSIAFRIKDSDLFINSFTPQGYIKLAKQPKFFDCIESEKPAIKYNNLYLSARDGKEGNFTLVAACQTWERFEFIEC